MWWSSARNHRPYLFDGTLREQIAYPARDSANELDDDDANATGVPQAVWVLNSLHWRWRRWISSIVLVESGRTAWISVTFAADSSSFDISCRGSETSLHLHKMHLLSSRPVLSNQINQLMSSWFACKEGMWNGKLVPSFVHVLFYWTLWLNIYEKDWTGTWQVIAVFVQAISCLPLAAFPSSDWGLGWFFVEPASYSVAVWCKVRVFQNVVPQHYTTLWNPPIHTVSQLQHVVTSLGSWSPINWLDSVETINQSCNLMASQVERHQSQAFVCGL